MIIESFLPNPIGKDVQGEYIVLRNNEPATINLSGWQIKDAKGKVFHLRGELPAGEALLLPYNLTKISLNNNGETVYLYNVSGLLIDELSYVGSAIEGAIITKNGIKGERAEKLIESWPELIGPINKEMPGEEIWFFGLTIAVLSAGLFTYVYKKLYGNETTGGEAR